MQSHSGHIDFCIVLCLTEDKLVIKGEWTTQVFLFFWEHSFRFLRLRCTGATRSCEWNISCHISKPGWHIHQEFPALQGAQEGGIHLWLTAAKLQLLPKVSPRQLRKWKNARCKKMQVKMPQESWGSGRECFHWAQTLASSHTKGKC